MARQSKQQIALAQRRQNALALRLQGGTYREIAQTMREGDMAGPKYDHTQAYDDVAHCLKEIRETTREDAEQLIVLEEQRLDALIMSLWQRVIDFNDYFALDRLLRILEMRWKLLGIGAPTKVALTDPTGNREYGELSTEQRMAELTAIFERARTRQSLEAAGAGTNGGQPDDPGPGSGEGTGPGGLETEPGTAGSGVGVQG